MEQPPENPSSPNISSFLIRFVVPEPGADGAGPPAYRGVVRYIPTGEEIGFTHWADAVQFIQRFLPVRLVEG